MNNEGRKYQRTIFALLVVMLTLFSGVSYAQKDFRLMIDLSGSMINNDPVKLRAPALQLFVDHLPEGANAAIWTFSDRADVLMPMGTVDSEWRESARQKLALLRFNGQRTDLDAALKAATVPDLPSSESPPAQFILLSDGVVDISSNSNDNQIEKNRVETYWGQQLASTRADFHALSFGGGGDVGFMNSLTQQSGGQYYQLNDRSDVENAWLSIMHRQTGIDRAPIRDQEFYVDRTVRVLDARLYPLESEQNLTLVAPDGWRYTRENSGGDISWITDKGNHYIRIQQPRLGLWSIEGAISENSKILLQSGLGLATRVNPQSATPGQTTIAGTQLMSYGSPVSDESVLRQMNSIFILTMPDGNRIEILPDVINGFFQTDLTQYLNQQGQYLLHMAVTGGEFQREAVESIYVVSPFRLVSTEYKDSYLVKVLPGSSAVGPETAKLESVLSNVAGDSKSINFVWQKGKFWQAKLPVDLHGIQTLTTTATLTDPVVQQFPLRKIAFSYPDAKPLVSASNSSGDMLKETINQSEENAAAAKMIDSEADTIPTEDPDSSEKDQLTINNNEINARDSKDSLPVEGLIDIVVSEDPDGESSEVSNEDISESDKTLSDNSSGKERPFIKFPIESVDVLDPSQIISVPSVDQTVQIPEQWQTDDEDLSAIPDTLPVDNGITFLDMAFMAIPGLLILGGFYWGFSKLTGRRKELSDERSELEDLLREEELKAESISDSENMDIPDIPDGPEISLEDLGKDSEHLFDDDIVNINTDSMDDMSDMADIEDIEDNESPFDPLEPLDEEEFTEAGVTTASSEQEEEDVFDLGDLSDLAEESDEDIEDLARLLDDTNEDEFEEDDSDQKTT